MIRRRQWLWNEDGGWLSFQGMPQLYLCYLRCCDLCYFQIMRSYQFIPTKRQACKFKIYTELRLPGVPGFYQERTEWFIGYNHRAENIRLWIYEKNCRKSPCIEYGVELTLSKCGQQRQTIRPWCYHDRPGMGGRQKRAQQDSHASSLGPFPRV